MDSKWWAKAEVGEALEEVATNGEVDQKEGGGGMGDSFSGSDLWLAPLLLVCSATDWDQIDCVRPGDDWVTEPSTQSNAAIFLPGDIFQACWYLIRSRDF